MYKEVILGNEESTHEEVIVRVLESKKKVKVGNEW